MILFWTSGVLLEGDGSALADPLTTGFAVGSLFFLWFLKNVAIFLKINNTNILNQEKVLSPVSSF